MPISDMVYLNDPNSTSTDAPGRVGETRKYLHPTFGMQTYRLVKATTAIAARELVAFDGGGSQAAEKTPSANVPATRIAGVAVVAIPAASYGWVCCAGTVVAIADAAVTQNAQVMSASTAGQVDDNSVAGNEQAIIGVAVADGSGFSGGEDLAIRLSGLL